MRTVWLIKLKDERGIRFPELNVLAEKYHDAQSAYLEYLHLDNDWYNRYENWESAQELHIHCDYDIEFEMDYDYFG